MNERYLSRHNTAFIDIDATLKPSVDKNCFGGLFMGGYWHFNARTFGAYL